MSNNTEPDGDVGGTMPQTEAHGSDEEKAWARESAVVILSFVWRSIDFEKWDRREIWGIFERRVKSAAIQNITLLDFFEQLKQKMRISHIPESSKRKVQQVVKILESNDQRVLNELRQNTTLCVLKLRVIQQERRKQNEH